MMLYSVFTKSLRDRWRGTAIAFITLALLLLFAMSIYRDLDTNVYAELPEVLLNIMGIPAGIDIGSLAVKVFLSGEGAWLLAGLTIAAGSAAIASEESDGTIGLLLGNPRSRTRVLISKAAAMIMLMGITILLLWGFIYIAAEIMGISIEGLKLYALSLHLFVNVLFYGFLAMAAGTWTGNRGTAVGVSTGVIVISILAVGILPLIEGWENLARAFPWYYFDKSDPLFNGISWGHVGILLGSIAVFAIISVIGVNRRDLKSKNVGTTIIDRLRSNPMTQKAVTRLAGSARVSRIWIKTLSEHQMLLVITGYIMFLTGLMVGPLYNFMPIDTLTEVSENFPEALFAALGGSDFSTSAGFLQLEIFGLMAPIALMVVTIVVAVRALTGEESHNTMGLLLANPVKRSTIVLEKSFTMLLCALIMGFATFAGVAAGALIGNLDTGIGNIAATSLLVTLLGLVYGALALAISAATGRGKIATFGTIGIAVVCHMASSFLPLNEGLEGYAKLSPFYYFLGSDPLVTGMHWGHAAILTGLALVLIVLSVVLFQKRDLKYTS